MSMPVTRLSVSLADQAVYVQISGRANFNSSVEFKTLIRELRQRGYDQFILDLTNCLIMDSTFLGVLAGIATNLAQEKKQPDAGIGLLNPNSRVSDLLGNLGVDHLFQTLHSTELSAREYQEVQPREEASKEEKSRNSLEAHLLLMSLHPDNIPKFKEVTKFLQEDLERLKSKPDAAGEGSS
jgi:anti-anti-sigma factor